MDHHSPQHTESTSAIPSGFLYVKKPIGPTSHDVVDDIRHIFGIRRVGHAGTLDPFADGLLIIGVGSATKQLMTWMGQDKRYHATIRLGSTSDTGDHTGAITETTPFATTTPLTAEEIERVLAGLRGSIELSVPRYSAKKVAGEKLYEKARRGEVFETPVQKILVSDLQATRYAWPELDIDVTVSTGAYIRSLGEEIGKRLGVGGHLVALTRVAIGKVRIEDALTIEEIEQKREQALHPVTDDRGEK